MAGFKAAEETEEAEDKMKEPEGICNPTIANTYKLGLIPLDLLLPSYSFFIF